MSRKKNQRKREEKTPEPEPPVCKGPMRTVRWEHNVPRTGSFHMEGGLFSITVTDSGVATISCYGGGPSGGILNGLKEDDVRCLARQFAEAVDQLTAWRTENDPPLPFAP